MIGALLRTADKKVQLKGPPFAAQEA